MATYNVWDVVRIVASRPVRPQCGWISDMDEWLGKPVTIARVFRNWEESREIYNILDDNQKWDWSDDMIVGLESDINCNLEFPNTAIQNLLTL